MPSCITVSKALRKSTKHAMPYSFLLPVIIYFSTKHFITNKWSDVLDFFEKPIWVSCIILLSIKYVSSLLFKMRLKSVPMCIVIPL